MPEHTYIIYKAYKAYKTYKTYNIYKTYTIYKNFRTDKPNSLTPTIIHMNNTIHRLVAALAVLIMAAAGARAMDLSAYADSSRLSTGRWVKVSVKETGLYRIPATLLRRWGFTDLSRVRVHGYGAEPISDVMSATNYVDDLPLAPMVSEADGSVTFYGRGPVSWNAATTGRFSGSMSFYTAAGYYFVSDSGEELPEMPKTATPGGTDFAETFTDRIHHEQDLASPGEAGAHLVGEDFRFQPVRSFSFTMPDRAEGDVWMECSFVAKTVGASSTVEFTVNGETQPQTGSDVISSTSTSHYYHGTEALTRKTLKVSGEKLEVILRHKSQSTVYGAWLNYLSVNYQRKLSLAGKAAGALRFWSSTRAMSLDGVKDDVRIWDVTSPRQPLAVDFELTADGKARWTAHTTTLREYVAYNPGSKLPEPKYEGTVASQNLHGERQADMVIVTHPAWARQAERIAAMHRAEGLTVLVTDAGQIYNEFASGAADVNALRRYFKMLYDRGQAEGKPLRYALLMGRATYDNKHTTQPMLNAAPTLPSWYGGSVRASLNDNDGFGTDDYLAMLDDGSGANKGSDKLTIAVGRIPVTSANSATNYVDKLEQYLNKSRSSGWKNQVLMLADDQDNGEHMDQADKMMNALAANSDGNYMVNKVYMDAYEMQQGNYPQAREAMFRRLNEGTAWWMFIGHANNHSMTHDGQLTYNDINNMYLKHVPVLYAATCDFLRWDSNTESGGEILFNERYGGTIAMISATRPVYIYENGLISQSFGRQMGQRDENGEHLRLGEIYRRAKNDVRDDKNRPVSSTNRLRYVLMGDPAMKMPIPDNLVRLDSIAGKPVAEGAEPEIAAMQTVDFAGTITDPYGNPMPQFNGYVTGTVYDAERSVTTLGNGKEGVEYTFDEQGGKLFAGSAPVKDGRFSLKVTVPMEIADNYRPAAISMYAVADATAAPNDSVATRGAAEAVGVNRMFYVVGYDETAAPDSVAPRIDAIYMNHSSFKEGDMVNPSPMLIAEISDDRAINLSESGLGHSMTLQLDGKKYLDDVAQFYTPNTDGTPSGTINYPLSDLVPGPHELTLRIWDTSNNPATASLQFNVGADVAPKMFDVYSDANPATTSANFYVVHDRPDQLATVTITVYNLLGKPLWSQTTTGMSDMFRSTPVTWNLCDASGRRVGRGIYLYRATIKCDGESYETESRRIAVTN